MNDNYGQVLSTGVVGMGANPVLVSCTIDPEGTKGLSISGLSEAAAREARIRVRSAIEYCALAIPKGRIEVTLDTHVPYRGTTFDLPIAIAILQAAGMITPEVADKITVVGELSLQGEVRPVPGAILMAGIAKAGETCFCVPEANATEAAAVAGVRVIPVKTLDQLVRHLQGTEIIPDFVSVPNGTGKDVHPFDMADVKGAEFVKEALTLAAAGGHGVLLVGPPGAGKTMLARRLTTILPPMTAEERLDITTVMSVSGLLQQGRGLTAKRPFRAPHHTISANAMLGGGTIPRPGELTLANHGVLFLDDLPEFSGALLERVTPMLVDRNVRMTAQGTPCNFPANVHLVAAMNECPCGRRGSSRKCACTPQELRRYWSRLHEPLMDLLPVRIKVNQVMFDKLTTTPVGRSSKDMRADVVRARETQAAPGAHTPRSIPRSRDMLQVLATAADRYNLSPARVAGVMDVARTVADMAGVEHVRTEDISRAIGFTCIDL